MNFNFINSITKHLALGFVVVSALVMGYILYELQTTKQFFASQLIGQSSDYIQTELDGFFLPINSLILTLDRQKEFNFFDDIAPSKLNQFYIPIIDRYPQVSSIGIANNKGYEIDILPDTVAGNWLNRQVNVEEWGMIEKWSAWNDEAGLKQTDSWVNKLKDDPRTRPWYTGAVQEAGYQIHWTELYEFNTNAEIGLTASIARYSNAQDSLLEILAFDITLNDITHFSQSVSITKNNQVFILTKAEKNIIGLPLEHEELNTGNLQDKLLSTPEKFGNSALISLLEFPINEIVSFKSAGKRWWGITQSYSINSTQELLIAVIIPENDFAAEINSTQKAMVMGFFIIIFLASLIVRNHNRLRKAKNSLNKQYEIISTQKERLFAEVHHRVKNNLAIMSALMELESMESEDVAVKDILTQTQRRVKSMSTVHEIMYKSDDMNKVLVSDFIPGILNLSSAEFMKNSIELRQVIDEVGINVNQALTYALLVNELRNSFLKAQLKSASLVIFKILKRNQMLVTHIKIDTTTDQLKTGKGVGKQLIKVLVKQLGADLKTDQGTDYTTYEITFELKDKKGIASNLSY